MKPRLGRLVCALSDGEYACFVASNPVAAGVGVARIAELHTPIADDLAFDLRCEALRNSGREAAILSAAENEKEGGLLSRHKQQ